MLVKVGVKVIITFSLRLVSLYVSPASMCKALILVCNRQLSSFSMTSLISLNLFTYTPVKLFLHQAWEKHLLCMCLLHVQVQYHFSGTHGQYIHIYWRWLTLCWSRKFFCSLLLFLSISLQKIYKIGWITFKLTLYSVLTSSCIVW